MYAKVEKFPSFPEIEKRILTLWKETRAFQRLREKNRSGPRWSFLDGPITANNPMGVHHAWGRSLKDMYQRFHAMCGHELRFQNGFDCQGLWVEVEVEKEHGISSKRDIERYGVGRFVEDCKERVRKFSRIQTEQSIRLGYWMDWDNSYFTMSDENNYTIWSFLKKCHQRGFVYKGLDAMPWCPRCGVGLSEMEMHEGYKWIEDLSVLVRFPLRHHPGEALLVWTTTPWTLTSNVAAAVHPDLSYYRVRQGDWVYHVGVENWDTARRIEMEVLTPEGKAKKLVELPTIAENLQRHGEVEILGTISGDQMVGWEYDGPFDDLSVQSQPGGFPHPDPKLMDRSGVTCHRVIPWREVTGSEGTGIVHIAPGCGREDFLLGREHGLVAISPLDEQGGFLELFGDLERSYAHEAAEEIVSKLSDKGLLIASEQYPHRYAHCWRCATPILYRLVDEWFISMQWRQEIMETVPKIRWIPAFGEQREMDWLRNMGDWMISKKRYWGLALPIWQCDRHAASDPKQRCDWFTVIASREELAEKAVAGWEEFDGHTPHRPWVDAVKLRCEACGGNASRIRDVGNPWLDAGIVPYSTMRYRTDRDYWSQWFPSHLVLECFPGQFRNWFYALLAMNAMMQEDRWADRTGGESQVIPPFRTVLGYALVLDEQAREMHKSLGNSIEFNFAAETIGAEVMRYIFALQNPTTNLRFPDITPGRRKDVVHLDQEVSRSLLTLWNCYSFFITYAKVDRVTPGRLRVPLAQRTDLDRWILSKLQGLVRVARDCFENYRVHQLMAAFERFLDQLSNWYLRRSRRRFWKSESDVEKLAAYSTLFEVLEGLSRLMAPVLPFLTEEIYQNLVRSVDPQAPVSVHLLAYPEVEDEKVDEDLEARIDTVVKYANLGLSLRNQAGIKVRQPLSKLIVRPADPNERSVLESSALRDELLEELNVKSLALVDSVDPYVQVEVRPNFKTIGPKYGPLVKAIAGHLAQADAAEVLKAVAHGGLYRFASGHDEVSLGESDLEVRRRVPEGLELTYRDGELVALVTALSPELEREGIARDFVRGVQEARKGADLHVADRIRVTYAADEGTAAAIEEWKAYICRETLARELATGSEEIPGASSFKAGTRPVSVAIEVVEAAES